MTSWIDGIMGVVVGDALGSPVQFHRRGEIVVSGMERCEHFGTPPGSWTDDSSLTLATLDSIREKGYIDPADIADRFVEWLMDGNYTPFGYAYDVGHTCHVSISRYAQSRDVATCGGTDAHSNGNGSLMRILPVCLVAENVEEVEAVSAITHAHRRAQIGCGIYYFIVQAIVRGEGDLAHRIGVGLSQAWEKYSHEEEFKHYTRLYMDGFADLPESEIESTGYVVHTLEAALWSLLNEDSFERALLRAVNLGDDADSVGAVCGGLAGLYYGYKAIPVDWIDAIQGRERIEELCREVHHAKMES